MNVGKKHNDVTRCSQFDTNACLSTNPTNTRVLEKLEKDLFPIENEEELSITNIVSIISSSDEDYGENKRSQEDEVSFDLRKPFSEAWQREYAMSEGRLSAVCDICGREVLAKYFNVHWKYCGLDMERIEGEDMIEAGDLCPSKNYLVEVSSEFSKFLAMEQGQCVVCSQQVTYDRFHHHMNMFHPPSQPCCNCSVMVPSSNMENYKAVCNSINIRMSYSP